MEDEGLECTEPEVLEVWSESSEAEAPSIQVACSRLSELSEETMAVVKEFEPARARILVDKLFLDLEGMIRTDGRDGMQQRRFYTKQRLGACDLLGSAHCPYYLYILRTV